MPRTIRTMAALGALSLAGVSAMADIEPVSFTVDASSVQVAGHNLKLNGAGVSSRLMFKIYAIGLYLPDRRNTVQDILRQDEPRRLVIRLLRDVDGSSFNAMMGDYARTEGTALPPHVIQNLAQLAQLLGARPQGLRNGDVLTFDWVPGTGTVVGINNRAVLEPVRGADFYHALLNIWLGDKPADPGLKTQLLGRDMGFARASH